MTVKRFIVLLSSGVLLHSIAIMPRSIAQSAPVTLDNLQNATYSLPNYGKVTLTNGNFQSDSGRITAVTASEDALLGNFDNEASIDGVVVLKVDFDPATGLRSKYYLALVTNNNGTPNNVNTVFLGEGIRVDRLTTKDGTVTVTMAKYYPGDPPCCPGGITTARYTIDPVQAKLVLANIEDRYLNEVNVRQFPVPAVLDDNLPYQPPADEIQVNF